MDLPRGRRDDLLTTNLDDEVVIYDPESKQAHSLNRLAVAVWNHADGSRSIEDLQRLASDDVGVPVDQASVWLALRKLERARLLTEKLGTGGPMTRREVLHKAGRLGATAMVTPIIASALVPMAAAAASPGACATPFVCGGVPIPFCDQTQFCSMFSRLSCICVSTPGGTRCVNTCLPCGSQGCNSNADCANIPNAVCWETSCCGNLCVVPCGQQYAPAPAAPGVPVDPLGAH
jgi:hypothetical protein